MLTDILWLFFSLLLNPVMLNQRAFGVLATYHIQLGLINSMPINPLQRVFYPQNRPCTPKIVGTFYMQGYKVKEKTEIVPHCAPSFKTQWAPWSIVFIFKIFSMVGLPKIFRHVFFWTRHINCYKYPYNLVYAAFLLNMQH